LVGVFFTQWQPTMTSDIYTDGSYLEKNPTWDVEDAPWKARQVRTIFTRNALEPLSVCEIGCGAGEILSQLSHAMPKTRFTGYEISPQALELCRARQSDRIEFKLGDVNEASVHYDCALCIDVFEHVEDYLGFVRSIRPKADYTIFHIPLELSISSVLRDAMMDARARVGHLHYFTKATALATLEHCGYEIVDHFYTTPFRDMAPRGIGERVARLPRRALFAVSPDWMVRLVGGCSLLVLAR